MFNRVRSMSFSSSEMDSLAPNTSVELLPTELREVYENWKQSDLTPDRYSGSVNASDWPVSIYVPERYEEGYAYPLVTWFHSDANDEDQLEGVMTAISSQNYLGLAMRGNQRMEKAGGYRWDAESGRLGNVSTSELLHLTTCRLRRTYHIHSERIFLAGSGHGADMALRTLTQHPEWFAGAILLDPFCEHGSLLNSGIEQLRNKPVLMSISRSCALETLGRCVRTVRTLRNAGAPVDVEMTDLPVDPASSEARMVDHWIMDCIAREALV